MPIKTHTDGFSLIEVLIAMIIFASGILGIAALQLQGVNQLANSDDLSTAVVGAADLADRMRTNLQGTRNQAYSIEFGQTASACTGCTADKKIAADDLIAVQNQLQQRLTSSALKIATEGNGLYRIHITWKEKTRQGLLEREHIFDFLPEV
jgi:type IV pilus assembly protein PilV